jgi:hypothetical protein
LVRRVWPQRWPGRHKEHYCLLCDAEIRRSRCRPRSAARCGSLRSATVSSVDGLFEVVGFVGIVLVTAGLVMILMAWGGMDERMPTQVPPRRLARYPVAAGTLLLVVAAVGLIVPGG